MSHWVIILLLMILLILNPFFDRFMHVYFVVVGWNVPATTEIAPVARIVSYQMRII